MGGFIFRGTTHIISMGGSTIGRKEMKKMKKRRGFSFLVEGFFGGTRRRKKIKVFKRGLAARIERRGEEEFWIALVRGKRNRVHRPLAGFCRRRTNLT